MASADLPQVEEIDGTAFSDLLTRLRAKPIQLPSHEREYFERWMACDPGGALVAENNGRIHGFIFCHARGRMGWIGPLAVRVGEQGRGIGKRLMLAGLDYFGKLGTATVGLDTFPENPVSVSLYLKTGFRVVGGLFMLTMPIPPERQTLPVSRIELGEVERFARLNERASGFDRRRDYEFVISSGLGCGLKARAAEDDFVFALVRRGTALIGNFHLTDDREAEARTSALVEGAFRFFRAKELKTAAVLCRGDDHRLLNALFRLGFTMNPTMITMHRGASAPPVPLTSPFAIEKG
jgi:GNAT superfamily N-acetyltransferase